MGGNHKGEDFFGRFKLSGNLQLISAVQSAVPVAKGGDLRVSFGQESIGHEVVRATAPAGNDPGTCPAAISNATGKGPPPSNSSERAAYPSITDKSFAGKSDRDSTGPARRVPTASPNPISIAGNPSTAPTSNSRAAFNVSITSPT